CLSDGGGERRLDSARAFAALVPAARAGARGGRGQARGPGSEPRVLRPEGRRRHVRPGDGRWAVRSSDLGRPPDRGSTEAARGAPRLAEAAAGVERRGGRGGGARRPGGGAETRVKGRHPNGTLPGPEGGERSLRQTALPAGPDPDPGLAAAAPDTARLSRFEVPRWVMLRSLVVPGWGQLYNGSWFKALAVAGGEVGLVAALFRDRRVLDRMLADVDRARASHDDVTEQALVDDYNARLNGYVTHQ